MWTVSGFARESPFGKPIAHGYFTVALIAGIFFDLVEDQSFAMVINYGLNKVRFPTPSRRGSGTGSTSSWATWPRSPMASRGCSRRRSRLKENPSPACVAELVFRFYGAG